MLMTGRDGRVGRNWRGCTHALPSSQREWIVRCFCEERQSGNALHPQNPSSGPVLHRPPLWTWGWSCFSPPSSWLLEDTSSVLCPFPPAHPPLQLPCPSSLGCPCSRDHSPLLPSGRLWWERMLLLFVPFILTVCTLQYCVLPGDSVVKSQLLVQEIQIFFFFFSFGFSFLKLI